MAYAQYMIDIMISDKFSNELIAGGSAFTHLAPVVALKLPSNLLQRVAQKIV